MRTQVQEEEESDVEVEDEYDGESYGINPLRHAPKH